MEKYHFVYIVYSTLFKYVIIILLYIHPEYKQRSMKQYDNLKVLLKDYLIYKESIIDNLEKISHIK